MSSPGSMDAAEACRKANEYGQGIRNPEHAHGKLRGGINRALLSTGMLEWGNKQSRAARIAKNPFDDMLPGKPLRTPRSRSRSTSPERFNPAPAPSGVPMTVLNNDAESFRQGAREADTSEASGLLSSRRPVHTASQPHSSPDPRANPEADSSMITHLVSFLSVDAQMCAARSDCCCQEDDVVMAAPRRRGVYSEVKTVRVCAMHV